MALDWLQGIMGTAYTPEMETAIEKELGKHFVPRATFNEANTKARDAVAQLADLEALKTAKATAEGTVTTLQQHVKAKDLEYTLKDALTAAKVVSVKAVTPLLDMTKIKIGDDGKLSGLTEQLTALQKTEPWIMSKAGAEVARTQTQLPLGSSSAKLSKGATNEEVTADNFMNNLLRGETEDA